MRSGRGQRIAAGVGRTLIAAGLLVLLFVVYQLWGTGLAEARSQDRLRDEFEAALAEAAAEPEPSAEPEPGPATTTTLPAQPAPPEGSAIAVMQIPRIDLEKHVVEGVTVAALKKAPGHYPDTAAIGTVGNAAIAGHRTTYGAPFGRLEELQNGDPILLTDRDGHRFRYEVTETKIVKPSAVEVLAPTEDARLTLTTCHPRYSARQRLVVVARLVGEAIDPPPTAPEAPAPERDPPSLAEAEAGLSGDPAARWPTAMWAGITAAIALAGWLLGRAWRRWPAYAVAAIPFAVSLFVFYENVARLLPANI